MDVTIIGAGIAGLAAGRDLRQRGWSVQLLDKGRGVGGRMATRRFAGGRYDTGAQFFSVRSSPFRRLMDELLLPAGAACTWYERGGEPYFRGSEGMTSIPKSLGEELDIVTGNRVTAIVPEGGEWTVRVDNGGNGEENCTSRALLLTPPVPQTLDLLAPLRDAVEPDLLTLLDGITYEPTLALLLSVEGTSPLTSPGYERSRRSDQLYWVADNALKGISPAAEGPALTVHASPTFSREWYDASEEESYDRLLSIFLDAYPPAGSYEVKEGQLKKWRYAKPLNPTPERSYLLGGATLPMAAVAGDAFGGPRVEGAYLSGLRAAELLDGALRSARIAG